uniref:Uncharacterized protein n=1 Tax=Amphimedon queenslandica TaxID=400682 RepID=A0A1X7UJX3_AMPQE
MFIGDTEIILFSKDDQAVQDSLDNLQAKFSHIMRNVKSAFNKTEAKKSLLPFEISNWVECYLHWEYGTLDDDLDDTFKKIYHHYDFSDCSLIVAMCNEFISDEKDLLDELKVYSLNANTFRSSTPITELKQKLRKVYGPYRQHLENMPLICIELQNPWNDVTINGLYILIGRLLPKELRQSIMKYITIEEGSVIIKLHILDITADSLIEYTQGKLQFMRLIGIFSLYINDHPILQEDENMNFTFDLARLEAVTAGNNEAVEFLLQLKSCNIDYINEEGKTELMLACERGDQDIVHKLLSAGANVDIQDNEGWTALMRAIEHSHNSIIHMLLEANANPHLKKSDRSNAVLIASYYGNYEIVELLISKGVDYKCQREDGWNAFAFACQKGHTQIVELLLKKKVDPNIQMSGGLNAFMLACQNGHTRIVELLLKEKVNPNVQTKDQVNAFMLACESGNVPIVELLLKEQVNPNVQDKNGVNAFMFACQNGHTQIVELLLKEQVYLNIRRNDGVNAFMLACRNGHTQIVELLLKEKVNPNVQTKDRVNAFMLACQSGSFPIVELLLKEQINPDARQKDGWNAFMLACSRGHIQIVELLLKKRVNPNTQSIHGRTPLMFASANGHYEVAKLLLEWKADPTIRAKSYNPVTALSLAKTPEISALLSTYRKKGIIISKEAAASVYSSAPPRRTVSSEYRTTVSNVSVTRSLPTALSLDT